MNKKTVVIIGAGPAGLTAAYQLLKNVGYKVIIIEANNQVGGLSRSEIYKGYKIDIGPHRFFSKSERVNNFWKEILPAVNTGNSQGNYWLSINRLTRILFSKKLFKYPIGLSIDTIKKLGVTRM